MDPDANLAEQRKLAARIIEHLDNDRPVKENDISRLADLVIALDEWISKGGFYPADWRAVHPPVKETA